MMKPSTFRFFAAFASLIIVFTAGCVQQYPQQEEAEAIIQRMEKHFADMENPLAAVDKVRKFACEKLSDMTSDEGKIINGNAPEIGTNFDSTEYSFTWKLGKNKPVVEVVTTPPPCEPIAVYRVSRVFYP